MSFINLYIQSGGNDANAGSSTANAADVTQTNGSWDITADTFIATGGTPFAGVATDGSAWASIYIDGGTVAVYVAQVTSLFTAGLGVVLSSTAKYGTKPAANATARSCKINGAWATEQPPCSGGLGATTVPAATKINIKDNLTITSSRTCSLAGSTTAPLWFSGYNTTPGDLDSDTTNGLAKPVWTLNSTLLLTTSGAYQLWSGLSVTGSRTGTVWNCSSSQGQMIRCRVENTSSNAGAIAYTQSGLSCWVGYCWFKTPTTATTTGTISIANSTNYFFGCVSEGGGFAGYNLNTRTSCVFAHCVALNNTGRGWDATTGSAIWDFCTVYNSTSDGIGWSGTPGAISSIRGCLFSICGAYGIANNSGTNTGNVRRSNNDFYSCSTGNELGFGDFPAIFGQTDSSAVATSSTDMTPLARANAHLRGFPGIFENQTYSGYADIGAVTRYDPDNLQAVIGTPG